MKAVTIRRIITVMAIGVIITGFVISKYLGAQKKEPKKKPNVASVPEVDAFIVKTDSVTTLLNLTGRVKSVDVMDVYAEVTGRINRTRKSFKDGVQFNKGEILLSIDNSDARLSLVAARANFQSILTQIQAQIATDYPEDFEQWQNYLSAFNPEKSLQSLPETENQQLKNLLATKNIYNLYYTIKSQQVQLGKYHVYAPFNGTAFNANLSPGTLIRAGQKVGELINNTTFELEVGVSIDDIQDINLQDQVLVTSENSSQKWVGTVSRISTGIDVSTQTYKVYIKLEGEGLSDGRFLSVQFSGNQIPNSLKIPSELLVDNNFVYEIIQDSILVKTPVDIISQSNGSTIIQGLNNGIVLLNQSMANARDSLIVTIK